MKKLLIIAALAATSPLAFAGWFTDNDQQKGQITQLQGQLRQQQEVTGKWQAVSAVLAGGCIITLVAGAAIGAKGRKASRGTAE